jgi:hypothetical protein
MAVSPNIAEGKLGIVDSRFEPDLGASNVSIGPPNCGAQIAKQFVCDPRAECKRRPSGGVECQCKGEGIEPPVGMRDAGSRCVTTTTINTNVVAPAVWFVLSKPGNSPDALKLNTVATGDDSFYAMYSRSTVLRRDGNVVAQSNVGLDSRIFGLSFEWKDPLPTAIASMALDAVKQVYSVTIEHAFTLALLCVSNATSGHTGDDTTCPQDGDTIETTIGVTPQGGNATPSMATKVHITAEVQAIISCKTSVAWVHGDPKSVNTASSFRLHVLAFDVDNLPISTWRGERWGWGHVCVCVCACV